MSKRPETFCGRSLCLLGVVGGLVVEVGLGAASLIFPTPRGDEPRSGAEGRRQGRVGRWKITFSVKGFRHPSHGDTGGGGAGDGAWHEDGAAVGTLQSTPEGSPW